MNETKIYAPREGYNLIAPYYDQWIWQKFWNKNEYVPYIKPWCETLPTNTYGLDIGTGSGNNLFCFLEKGHKIDASDISECMLENCKRKHAKYIENGQLECLVEDAVNIVRYGRKYDWILSNRVFSHIEDLNRVVSRIAAVIKYNGLFFFSDIHPLHHYNFTNTTVDDHEIRIETHKHKIDEIKQIFTNAKFEIVSYKEIPRNGINDGDITRKIDSLMRQDPNIPIFFYFIFRYKG